MSSIENSGQRVKVNYQAPLWATIASSALLLLVVGFLTFISLNGLYDLIANQRDGFTAIFCGLLDFVFLAGVIFFVLAIFKGIRDLATPMQYANGMIVDHSARQRWGGGAYWLVLDTDTEAEAAPTGIMHYVPLAQSKALRDDRTRRVFGADPEPDAPAPPVAPIDDPARLFANNERLSRPTILRFRVDKPVYEALRLNDRVTIAYSRNLQHVYYVQQWEGNSGAVLYNRSLL